MANSLSHGHTSPRSDWSASCSSHCSLGTRWRESRTGCPAFLSKFIVIGVIDIKDKETKSERINLHLTPTAKSIIADKASALDMNMTAYITACAVVKDVYVIGDKDTFNELVYQVKRIGGNINQLRMLSQLGRIECVNLSECTAELDNIRKILNTIIRKANKWQR